MANDTVIGVTIKGIGDFSDVVSNVGSVQKALTKLKLPDKLGDNLNKNITNFYKEYEKYQKKVAEGIHTQGDQNAVNKSLNSMLDSYEKIIKDFGKISSKDFKDIFNLDEGQFASVQKRIKDIEANIKKIRLDPEQLTEPLKVFQDATKAKSLFGSGKGFDRLTEAFESNNLEQAKQAIAEIDNYLTRFGSRMDPTKFESLKSAFAPLKQHVLDSDNAAKVFTNDIDKLNNELGEIGGRGTQELNQLQNGLKGTDDAAKSVIAELKQIHANEFDFNRQAADIDRQIQSYFGLSQMIRKVGDIARDAFATVKELDAAMTQTAVVTNFSVGDMWNMLPTYTAQANQLGSTIKDVYEAATLYYQQGLNTNQAMGLANETLKMARIAGLDAAEATNMMTAALRGFNMEINQASAQKINDIYSELAAITASDTKEIGSAMERTASIANAANMDFATTSAFLAQMIETTREAPENLGTAMKTIVARFQEMKQDPTKLVDSEGVAMDVNKVDKALKTIGVSLTNTKGEFRDLDDVFLDISAKWDSLSQGQQRYIATIAAGSRQQSRFIAMMSDYERTMELVEAANNSAGASQRQFEKTLDSMGAKLNMLKNAWDQFTMGLMNNQILKFGVDRLTDAFTIVNKFIDVLGSLPPKPFEGITKSVLTLVTTLGMLSFGKKATRGLVLGGAGWWKGETSFTGGFKDGWKSSGQTGFFANKKDNAPILKAKADAVAYKATIQKEMANNGFLKAIGTAWKTKSKNFEFTNTFQAAFGQFSGERFAASWSADIETEITRVLNSVIDDAAKIGDKTGQEFKQHLLAQLKAGEISGEQLISSVQTNTGKDISNLGVNAKEFDNNAKAAENFGNKINSAGEGLLRFGAILEGTPLAPFGTILSTIGMTVMQLGTAITWASNSFMVGMGKVVAAEGMGAAATKLLAGGFKQLWIDMGPVGWAILAITALASAYMLLKDKIPTAANKLNKITDAAAAASEAYDSAKQETSELTDAIEQVKSNEEAFDGLVAGTAAFNEQLVTANDQIMDLIKKYPMLNDPKYFTTDKNGLMHINDEGLEKVKEYQKQRQANAGALNLIQTADLNSEETRQKAEQMRKVKGAETVDTVEQRRKEADLLEQQAEAQQQMAKLNAVNAALVDKEIGNREKVSSIMADQYDARRDAINLEGESIHDLKQEYADFYGYTYDKSTKKIKDIEGNDIDVSDDTIKDAVKDIRVITDIEVDASSVESVLHSLDRDFSKTLGDSFENSSTFISDILSNNAEINEDLLEQVLDNPDQLNDFVEGLSAKEIAAVLGASEEVVESNIDGYKQQLEDKLLTNARNIIDTNAQANGELAAMLAQAQGKTTSDVLNSKEIQNNLMQQVKDFTSEQRNTLLNIGKTLETSVGSEAMATFVDGLSDIYQTGNEKLITTAQNWADSVNWDSAIGRLEGYNEAINMTADDTNHLGEESVKQINNLGQALLDSRDEANLLGEAFTEFYNSTDFQDMAENMDKFVDSSGQLNATSIMDMAEECGSLNNLLDTGAISAGGVAAALNALGSDGDLVLSDLNSKVLELLSNFGQLDGIIASSHRNIENFDWGIDTGESADFVKESAEKWNELYNNGEVGNPQLEAYAKYVLGEEKYIALLAEHSGDLQATMDDVSKYVNEYSEGFDKAWSSLADGGWEKKVPKELQDLNISFGYDENGKWEWDPGSATTEQLSEWLQAVKGIGPEMAAAMIEDWQNYSGNFRAERQKNDFQAGLDSYIEQRKGANGEIAITASELQTIASSTGQDIEEVRAAIAERAGIEANQIEVLENIDKNTGEYVTDGAVLNKELSQTLGANGQNGWLAKYQATDSNGDPMKNTIDLGNAIAGAVERGYTQAQATSMAYESYTNAEQQGKDYYYKGELIEAGQYKSLDDFAARLAEIDQNEQWVTIGQTMADAWIARIDEHENGTDSESDKSSADKPGSDSTKSTGNKNNEETGSPRHVNMAESERRRAEQESSKDERSFWQKFNDWVKQGEENRTKNMNDANSGAEERTKNQNDFWHDFWKGSTPEGHTELTPAQYQKMYGGSNSDVTKDKADESNNNLQEATSKLQEGGTQIETAATKLDTGAAKIESAATKLETAASNLSKPEELNSKNSTIPKGSTIPGAGFVESGAQSVNGGINIETSDADAKITILQTKLKNLNDLVNQGGTYKLKVPGLSDIKSAATAARTLTKNSGTKTIGVKTGKADMSSVKDATKTIGNTEAKIKVGATVDAAIAAARRAQRTIGGMSATIDVEAHVRKTGISSITIDGKTVTIDTAASGKHNHGYAPAPSFGSAARGRYGQVGPKGKGGLTLTGELGYEVAWLPDENRSMVLGANGPQMINLPGNAVVWDHEQSKKILKQKAIPAGSHSNSTRPGSNLTIGGGGGASTSTVVQKAAKAAQKAVTTAAVKVGKVSVWWENIARTTEGVQRKADKAYSEFQKYIKEIQATLKLTGTEGQGNKYIKNMSKVIGKNQAQYNKANKSLKKLDKSNKKTTIKYKQGKKEKKSKVKLGSFIQYDKESGSYVINQKKLNKIAKSKKKGGKAKAQAIKDAAEKKINNKLSKRNQAEDAILKAKEALDKFGEELYNTFFAWENELTEIWNLTQKIESIENKGSNLQGYLDLLDAQLDSGLIDKNLLVSNNYGQTGYTQEYLHIFQGVIQTQIQAIHTTSDLIQESTQNLSDLLTSADTQATLEAVRKKLASKRLNATERLGYEQWKKELTETLTLQSEARQYITPVTRANGTIDINFNAEGLRQDKIAGRITGEKYTQIKKYIEDGIIAQSKALSDLYDSTESKIASLYQQLADLKKDWAEQADTLMSYLEDQQAQEIESIRKISDAIANSLKNLLDKVKDALDERRKREDNVKTEESIVKKQQRLAMLRADTSGGHQVEIAQLQQEIVDDQMNYQRTLEDQLLDRLQKQADIAQKQREEQISLQEAILQSVDKAAIVNAWMDDPAKYRSEIQEAFYSATKYADMPLAKQEALDSDFDHLMIGLEGHFGKEGIITNAINNLADLLPQIRNQMNELAKEVFANNPSDDGSNRTKEQVYQDTLTELSAKGSNITFEDIDTTLRQAGTDAGYGTRTRLQDLANMPDITWKDILKVLKGNYNRYRLALTFSSENFKKAYDYVYGPGKYKANRDYAKKHKDKYQTYAYATGGLNTTTGLAWLDGTPSKPELVLNSTDTKNFLALRDILSKAIGSANSITNSYGGDATYEININVDHLSNDYDVDKVAERVKKIIVKDSSYRNVTQVRNFR